MGVRRHLTTLERDGLIQMQTQRQPTGRPTFVYRLTEADLTLFPKVMICLRRKCWTSFAPSEGDARVSQIFAGRMDQLYEQYMRREWRARISAERVQELRKDSRRSGLYGALGKSKGWLFAQGTKLRDLSRRLSLSRCLPI